LLSTSRVVWWTTLAEWVSTTRMMSTKLAALEYGSHYRVRQTPSLDPPGKGPCLGIKSRSSSGVSSYYMGIWSAGRVLLGVLR
jgi:hypothetical protein